MTVREFIEYMQSLPANVMDKPLCFSWDSFCCMREVDKNQIFNVAENEHWDPMILISGNEMTTDEKIGIDYYTDNGSPGEWLDYKQCFSKYPHPFKLEEQV